MRPANRTTTSSPGPSATGPSATANRPADSGVPTAPLPLGSQSGLRLLECSAQDAPVSVIIFGPDGVCGWANPATETLLGVADCGDLVGRLDLRRHCSSPEGAAIPQGLNGQEMECLTLRYHLGDLPPMPAGNNQLPRLSKAPDKIVTVSAKLVPLLDDYGAVVALCVFNKRQEGRMADPAAASGATPGAGDPQGAGLEDTRLQHSISAARNLSKRLAHDFNNIIAVVQGYAELLQARLARDEEARNMAEVIGQMGAEASSVTHRLASFANTPPLNAASLDLNQVVRDFLSGAQAAAPPAVQVHLELAEGLPPVSADPDRLQQACRHLWQNALDAMPKGGKVSWRTEVIPCPAQDAAPARSQLPFLRLRVTDTGVGMDEATRRSMFDPFFTTKHGKSRGLGLTEVYETVKQHEGFVEVSSAPARGTCVDLYLPVERAAEQAKARPVSESTPEVPAAVSEPGRRWLIVDDNRLVRLLLQQMLVQAGHQVTEVATGPEALAFYQCQGAEIDGVFLDLDLGEMSGAQVFQRLREINSGVRVIILTGDTYQQTVGDLRAQGNCGVLAKPFRREDVMEVVSRGAAACQAPPHRSAA